MRNFRMEYHPNKRDLIVGKRGIAQLNLLVGLKIISILLLFLGLPVKADSPSCEAVFAEGVQSHQVDGEISFDWNAQLLTNPDNSLAVARVNDSSWSMLASCGASACSATGQKTAALDITFDSNTSTMDYQVVYRGNATIGTHQLNRFRKVVVESEGNLFFSEIVPAYHIKTLTLGYAATLNLAPGTYWIETLSLATASQINVVGEGTVRLFVKNNLSFPWQSFANMESTENPRPAEKLFIYTENDLTLQAGSQISAVVYSKKRLSVAQAKLYGTASFHRANLGSSAIIQYQPDAVSLSNLGSICGDLPDEDNPPPVEEPEPDIGSGDKTNTCYAAFTNGLQSHGENGAITFQYNAQLHEASNYQLPAANVHISSGSAQHSCTTTQCVASGVPAQKLNAGLFKTTLSSSSFMVPWAASMTIDGDDALEYGQITAAANATINFTAQSDHYLIRELALGYNSTLKLPAGDYWVERLLLQADTDIQVIGAGTVRLYVKETLYVPWMATINSHSEDAAKFILYHYNNIEFHSGSETYALIYSDGQVKLNYQAQIYGGLNAGNITLDSNSHVTFISDAVATANFGAICGSTAPEPDLVPPQLQVNQTEPQTEVENVLITGTVSDPTQESSGIASVVLSTGQGHQITAAINGETFSANVPLVLGDNTVTITARDYSDNITSANVSIKRISFPQIIIQSPATGTEVDFPQVTLVGEVHTAWPVSGVQFFVNNTVQSLSEFTPGIYQFNVALTLESGINTVAMRAITADGDVDVSLQLIYTNDDRDGDGVPDDEDAFPDDPNEWSDLDSDGIGDNDDPDRDGDGFANDVEQQAGTNPDDANDYPDIVPPVLQITNVANETVETATLIIQGSVSDPVQPYSGIDTVTVTSNRYAGTTILGTIEGALFQAEAPLALGNNLLTITLRDRSGNSKQVTHQVQRISPPHFRNVTPANGSVITEETVTIAGEVQTLLPLTAVRFYVNEWQITPNETEPAGVYAFTLPGITLQLGQNNFSLRVETADGIDTRNLTLTYTPEDPESMPAPEISLVTPVNGSQLQDASFRLKGRVISHAGFAAVTVNGQTIATPSSNGQDYYFERTLSFPEGENSISVIIEARDTLNKTTQLTAQYYRDDSPPQIIVNGNLQPSPAINLTVDSPFNITGSVSDINLSSVTVNDQPLALRPGSAMGNYDFALPVSLAPGAQSQLVFNAYDLSGNRTSVEYLFQSSAQTSLTPLLPGDAAQFLSHGEPVVVQVAARLSNTDEDYRVRVSVGAQQTELTLAGTLASGDLSLPVQAGDYTLTYQVLNSAHEILASASRRVSVVDDQAIAFELIRHAPENNAVNIEPNEPIELYFNKPIDITKLTVAVRETLHGNTYVNLDASGADFLVAQGHQLQEVHRDNEVVPGAVSLLPGNQSLAFYANRHFGFNADIYVDVNYEEEELGRFNFKVRALPTFVIGGVADQFGQPLAGIKVTMPGLNRITTTNNDGSFAFGFMEPAGNEIPGGRHTLMINPEFAAPGYGTQVRRVNLQQGRKNEISLSRLPELHPDVPFQLISSGQASVSLASDELRLDLTGARLLFANGRTAGNLQVQFMPFGQLNTATTPGAWPQWMFASQPRGVTVEQPIGIDIKIPALNGNYDYLSPETKYVVLLGYDPEREVIEPIGIGHIKNYRVTSVGKVRIKTLDYIGYALVDPAQQTLLQEVADGTRTLQQLLSELQ